MTTHARGINAGSAWPAVRKLGARAKAGRVAAVSSALAWALASTGCSTVTYVSSPADRVHACTSSSDCRETVGVALNAFGGCDFQFNFKTINVPAGVTVEWNIAPGLVPMVSFANDDPVRGIDIKQDEKNVSLRPFINPQSGTKGDGSLYFRWTANPDPAVSHEELPYFANVRVMKTANEAVRCTSEPTIANNHH